LDGCEEFVIAFVLSGCNSSEEFDLTEEAFEAAAPSIEMMSKAGNTFTHRADVGHRATGGEAVTKPVAVIGQVGGQYLTCADPYVSTADRPSPTILGLAFGQVQPDRAAVGIGQKM